MRFVLVAAAVLLAFAVVLPALRGGGGMPGDITWQTEVPDADAGRRSVLYFTADWCPPCRVMKSDAWPDERVEAVLRDHYTPVYVDIDARPDLVRVYGIESVPTIIVKDGDAVVARGGFGDADMLHAFLTRHADAGTP